MKRLFLIIVGTLSVASGAALAVCIAACIPSKKAELSDPPCSVTAPSSSNARHAGSEGDIAEEVAEAFAERGWRLHHGVPLQKDVA